MSPSVFCVVLSEDVGTYAHACSSDALVDSGYDRHEHAEKVSLLFLTALLLQHACMVITMWNLCVGNYELDVDTSWNKSMRGELGIKKGLLKVCGG